MIRKAVVLEEEAFLDGNHHILMLVAFKMTRSA